MKCQACGKEIVFLRTENGKIVPVDKETTDPADEYYDPRERGHVSHFKTCTDPGRFSRKAKR
jgi:predicted RNA-binding protein with PUA-like domain